MDSALFLYTEEYGYPEIDGSFQFDLSEYQIDNCGLNCHVLIKLGWNILSTKPDEVEGSESLEDDLFNQEKV